MHMDDILISGHNDTSHLRNLCKAFPALNMTGLKLKRSKCKFLLLKVTSYSFKINKEGTIPLPEKVTAMIGGPTPNKVKELKAYLGAMNYYHNY